MSTNMLTDRQKRCINKPKRYQTTSSDNAEIRKRKKREIVKEVFNDKINSLKFAQSSKPSKLREVYEENCSIQKSTQISQSSNNEKTKFSSSTVNDVRNKEKCSCKCLPDPQSNCLPRTDTVNAGEGTFVTRQSSKLSNEQGNRSTIQKNVEDRNTEENGVRFSAENEDISLNCDENEMETERNDSDTDYDDNEAEDEDYNDEDLNEDANRIVLEDENEVTEEIDDIVNNDKAFKLFVVRKIKELSTRMKKVEESLEYIRKREQSYEKRSNNDHTFYQPDGFSLQNMEDYKAFCENEEQHRILQSYLEFVGGHSLRECINRYLKESMSDNLSTKFTWTGTSNKEQCEKLCDSPLSIVIFRALVNNHNLNKPTRKDFCQGMQEGLRTAKQRARESVKRSASENRRLVYEREMDVYYGKN